MLIMTVYIANRYRYILKSMYSTIIYLSIIIFVFVFALIQKEFLSALILGLIFVAIVLLVLLYTSIKTINKKKYVFLIINENDFYIVDKNDEEIKLKTKLLKIRNPILNFIFSPLLLGWYLYIVSDCYLQFENCTYFGVDLSIKDYFRIKKLGLKNVEFFKIGDYIKIPFL